ncbi:MAG: hypothetical protein HQK51_12000 [Oligoflexia bacterium]|nr:hypothetical protein [Oligoflexia bacterium]
MLKLKFFILIFFTLVGITIHAVYADSLKIDTKENFVSSSAYEYFFDKKNHLLINKLFYKQDRSKDKSNKKYLAISDSDLFIHLDMKNFFNIDITKEDVQSEILSTFINDNIISEKITFFYKLLFFKIRLKMDTKISFYENKAHIPMNIDVPTNGSTYLNPGSGLLYFWKNGELKFELSNEKETLPKINLKKISNKIDFKGLVAVGLKYCNDSSENCVYKIKAKLEERNINIDIFVPKDIVKNGFYPMWIDNISEFNRIMKWSPFKENENNSAVYFEISGLKKGQFVMDYFITMY